MTFAFNNQRKLLVGNLCISFRYWTKLSSGDVEDTDLIAGTGYRWDCVAHNITNYSGVENVKEAGKELTRKILLKIWKICCIPACSQHFSLLILYHPHRAY